MTKTLRCSECEGIKMIVGYLDNHLYINCERCDYQTAALAFTPLTPAQIQGDL